LKTTALKQEGLIKSMNNKQRLTLAIFYCQNVPESNEQTRQELEKQYQDGIRLFPIPCSGRLEPVHLLKALETFADAAYVITCPEGACRYFQGNRRAKKRVERAQAIIESIGLEKERLDIIVGSIEAPKTLPQLVEELVERASRLEKGSWQ
jgi:F420-non-reducing hydrogenase iron-sulfur subunit